MEQLENTLHQFRDEMRNQTDGIKDYLELLKGQMTALMTVHIQDNRDIIDTARRIDVNLSYLMSSLHDSAYYNIISDISRMFENFLFIYNLESIRPRRQTYPIVFSYFMISTFLSGIKVLFNYLGSRARVHFNRISFLKWVSLIGGLNIFFSLGANYFYADYMKTQSMLNNQNDSYASNETTNFLGIYMSRNEHGKKVRRFMTVDIKNLDNLDDDKLRELFEKYGKITSAKGMSDDVQKSNGFGVEEPENDEKAIDVVKGKELNGKSFHVGRRSKRATEFNYHGAKLYVTNLDDAIDDERLRKEFAPFGTITSVKVMTDDNGHSSGFGFVCFSSPEEATKAVTEMNGRIVVSKPLYVAVAQRNEDRKAHLASQYMQLMAGMCMQLGQIFNPGNAGYFVPTMPQAQRSYFPQMAQMPATQRWFAQPQMRPGAQPVAAFQAMQLVPYPIWAGMNAQTITSQQPTAQKQMVGERLFFLIHRWYPDLARKITRMLLEIDNSELLHMLEHHESLKTKVEEAVAVLQAHHAKETLSVTGGIKKDG